MKTSLQGFEFYTGRHVPGFTYGLGDRNLHPETGLTEFAEAAGFPRPRQVVQVHGRLVLPSAQALQMQSEADALLVEAGEAAAIRVADCVPIILINPKLRKAAAIHAGWRGTFARIVEEAVRQMGDVKDLFAWIGPAIGACCYRISDDLAEKFRGEFGPGPWLTRKEGQPYLDLPALNAHLLKSAGISQIDLEKRCTFDGDDLHSFRRDGEEAGRMAAFVFVDP